MTTIYDIVKRNAKDIYDEYSAAVAKQHAEIDDDDAWDFNHTLVTLTHAKCGLMDVVYQVVTYLDCRDHVTKEDIDWIKKTLHEMVDELV